MRKKKQTKTFLDTFSHTQGKRKKMGEIDAKN